MGFLVNQFFKQVDKDKLSNNKPPKNHFFGNQMVLPDRNG